MKKTTTKVATAQGAVPTQADLFSMFQAFMAQQGAAMPAVPVAVSVPVSVPIVGAEDLKSKARKAKSEPAKVETVATVKPAKVEPKGVHIHKLANSCFVYGSDAQSKLSGFLTRKPHLDRGFKERNIDGIGIVKAYWFGGRQIAKIEKELSK